MRSAFRTMFGRRSAPVLRRSEGRLRLIELEARNTPSTLLVDDNFTPDPAHHRFNSIQAAVNAARPHDDIRVFAGTYTEAVTITKTDVDLTAVGRPGQVRIQGPAGADIVVQVAGGAKDVDIVGFTIIGGNAGIQFGTHFDSPASLSGSGSAKSNVIQGYAQVGLEAIGTGTRVDFEGNVVTAPSTAGTGAPIGIQISDGARGDVERNIVSGNLGSADNEGVGILVFQTSRVNVERNSTFNNDEGILLASFDPAIRVTQVLVSRNVTFNNRFNGIGLFNADNNQILDNVASFNDFDGINVGSDPTDPNAPQGTAQNNLIKGNTAEFNGRAGIFLEQTATSNMVIGNRLFHNNTHNLTDGADAVDLSHGTGTAGTANRWKDNRGNTSLPDGLVRPGGKHDGHGGHGDHEDNDDDDHHGGHGEDD